MLLSKGGLLLYDSVFLYRNRKYASATAIALFAVEIGRSRLLFRFWEEMVEKGVRSRFKQSDSSVETM